MKDDGIWPGEGGIKIVLDLGNSMSKGQDTCGKLEHRYQKGKAGKVNRGIIESLE